VFSLVALAAAAAAAIAVGGSSREILMSGNFVRDPLADALKVAIFVVTALAFVYSRATCRPAAVSRRVLRARAVPALGMSVMVSAGSFLSAYWDSSCWHSASTRWSPSTATRAPARRRQSSTSCSARWRPGCSSTHLHVYGASGALDFATVSETLRATDTDRTVLVFGLVFVVIGIAFKFGAVPFHMWVPDVYQGAPTPVTLLLGSAPKIAAFALAMRLLGDGLGVLHGDWQQMLVLSRSPRSHLAMSWRSPNQHQADAGVLDHLARRLHLPGLLAGTADGEAAAMFYSILYALMAAGAFGVLVLLSREGLEAEQIEDLRGLNQRSPWYAGMMLLLMFSMAACHRPPGLRQAVRPRRRHRHRHGLARHRRGVVLDRRRLLLPAGGEGDVLRRPGDESPCRPRRRRLGPVPERPHHAVLGFFPAALLSICTAAVPEPPGAGPSRRRCGLRRPGAAGTIAPR